MNRLQKFADRIARHPTLQRSKLVHDFLTSTEWVSPVIEPGARSADALDRGEALPHLASSSRLAYLVDRLAV